MASTTFFGRPLFFGSTETSSSASTIFFGRPRFFGGSSDAAFLARTAVFEGSSSITTFFGLPLFLGSTCRIESIAFSFVYFAGLASFLGVTSSDYAFTTTGICYLGGLPLFLGTSVTSGTGWSITLSSAF